MSLNGTKNIPSNLKPRLEGDPTSVTDLVLPYKKQKPKRKKRRRRSKRKLKKNITKKFMPI